MGGRFRSAAVIAATLVGLHSADGQTGEIVGRIRDIEGKAFLRQGGSSTEVPLRPEADKARVLFAGDMVRCDPGGRLVVWLATGTQPIRCGEWVTMTPRPARPEARGGSAAAPDPVLSTEIQKAIETFVRPAGSRAEGSTIFSPPRRAGRALVDTFAIRWTPLPGTRIVLRLWDEQGRELWRALDVDGGQGTIDAASVRAALAKERARLGTGRLTLSLSREGIEDRVTFTLLAEDDELALRKELKFWEGEPDAVFRHIGRGAAFAYLNLFVDAADEYEAALTLAPASQELMSAAIEAHVRTGNARRELELRERIK
jgi:hypothetical protein